MVVGVEGFDTSGNPVRQSRNQLEITQKINGNQLEIEVINQKSQNIGSGAREGTYGNRLINRLVTPVAMRAVLHPSPPTRACSVGVNNA